MAASEGDDGLLATLARRHMPLAGRIATRLHRSYGWVGLDDLRGYAYLGLALAARVFESDRGIPFDRFAATKARYLAIDEMRKDGVVQRRGGKPTEVAAELTRTVRDPKSARDHEAMLSRDLCATLLGKLNAQDRRLLMMYYADGLTLREISQVMRISESALYPAANSPPSVPPIDVPTI